MYIQNRRDSSKFKGCSPLQNRNGLISLKPAIANFAYTKRCSAFKMRHPIAIILLIIQSLFSYGQARHLTDDDYNNSGARQLTFITRAEEAKDFAKADIKKLTPFLLLASGIAPIVYTTDETFENTYNVYYYERGDVAPDLGIMIAYNEVIFEYLDNQYGKKWRRSIRKDVIGFKKWRRRN